MHGHLDRGWADWFDGLTISHPADGCTLLAGDLPDQAALHGTLSKVRDLGLPLLTVRRVPGAGDPADQGEREH